jgi:membrane protein DedA with SNARE-associated domain
LLGSDAQYAAGLLQRYGVVGLVLCRGVPIFAEASVITAGVLGMPARRFIAATALANIGVAGLYAAIGAAASNVSPAAAFAAALVLPGICLLIASAARRMGQQPSSARASH